jgi:hypothetical protein
MASDASRLALLLGLERPFLVETDESVFLLARAPGVSYTFIKRSILEHRPC